jgi:ABC-type multidrug transport system fused ATPase/permease subunit
MVQSLSLAQSDVTPALCFQDSVLFRGSIRSNLDPFGEHEDSAVWAALASAELRDTVQLSGGLSSEVEGGGKNFSSGQRQLLCLARAVLRLDRGSRASGVLRVLVLDEATATVDTRTDACLQRMLREHFLGVTVLAIAHRLETVLDADKILVLQHGRAAEFGAPENLRSNVNGLFKEMCQQARTAQKLRSVPFLTHA